MCPVSNEVSDQSPKEVLKAGSGARSESRPSAALAFWQILALFDSTKLSKHRAFRNALGVVLPLIAGFALHMPRGALVVASGALNVSSPTDKTTSDSHFFGKCAGRRLFRLARYKSE